MLLTVTRNLRDSPVYPWRLRMLDTVVAILSLLGAKEKMRRLNVVDCTPRYGSTRSLCGRISITGGSKGRT